MLDVVRQQIVASISQYCHRESPFGLCNSHKQLPHSRNYVLTLRQAQMRPQLGSSPSQRKNSISFVRSGTQRSSTPGHEQDDLEQGRQLSERAGFQHNEGNGSAGEPVELASPSKGPERAPEASARGFGQGQLCLLGVAVLWGSYSPALRYIFSLNGPPSAEALTAVRAVLQSLLLLGTSFIFASRNESSATKQAQENPMAGTMAGGRAAARGDAGVPPILAPLRRWLGGSTQNLALAGAELGLWNFLASSFQALGLEITSATRASFLIQVTALLTPALATVAGDKPGRSVWAGCGVALAGTLLLMLDKAPPSVEPVNVTHLAIGGDACIFAAALFYSLATVRLSRLAASTSSLRLATAKSAAFAVFSTAWLAVSATNQVVSHEPLSGLWLGYRNPAAWAVLVWSAIGPGALAAFLQTQGQKRVPAAQAQIIFSSLPLWSALFAALLLQGERMGGFGWVGGLLIVCAGLIASRQ